MEEIKFRGKSKWSGEFVYGYLVKEGEQTFIIQGGRCYREERGIVALVIDNWHEVDPETIGQYIQVDDKEGVPVFQGDIVEGYAIQRNGGFYYKGKVVFYCQNNVHGWHVEDKEGAWEINQLATKISLDNITGKIIGNIHDNPELFEEVN